MKKNEVLRETANEELNKKVIKQMGMRFWEIMENLEYYRNAGNGVSGFIYYGETEKFFKKNSILILEAVRNFEEDCGTLEKTEPLSNWYSWFALENCIQELMDVKEMYNL
ncbi:hypothetical protein [Mesoflavibacter sp. SCSIO 43206]|uniref:DUF7222 domain-containing protein n=1 Tax=Mesoflavibacter sp. SCSIO 43206 TaxID=2779362 RepID=UPI001CA915F3|nr:hypothetical protein [Mesoflavibacter sp. SCSIO 43206]UAB75137.1 hypothetical protein INR78_12205 [Mesoflavibacter sp. SCSIO 43206]